MYYLRKITRGKWPEETLIDQITPRDIMMDTIIAELKTDNNKLSVWKVENDEDIKDVFIALGSNCSNIGNICLVKISNDDIQNLNLDEEDGNTPTNGINQKHNNIIRLNYGSLGDVISSIIKSLRDENMVLKKSRPEMKKLLAEAYLNDKLIVDKMDLNLVKEIEKEADKITNVK